MHHARSRASHRRVSGCRTYNRAPMHLQVSVPLHFAAEFLMLVVAIGAMFQGLRARSGPGGGLAWVQAAGFGALAVAQILHGYGAWNLNVDSAPALAVIRATGFALILAAARPAAVFGGAAAAPAILVTGGPAPG